MTPPPGGFRAECAVGFRAESAELDVEVLPA